MVGETKKNPPIKKFSCGLVTANLWKETIEKKTGSKTETFDAYSLSIERAYLDRDKKWKNTSSMRIRDLPRVKRVVDKMFDYWFRIKESADPKEAPVASDEAEDKAEEIVM